MTDGGQETNLLFELKSPSEHMTVAVIRNEGYSSSEDIDVQQFPISVRSAEETPQTRSKKTYENALAHRNCQSIGQAANYLNNVVLGEFTESSEYRSEN